MPQAEVTDQEIQEQVSAEIENAKEFAKGISLEEIQSGEWFVKLLRQVILSYEANGRAEYFQQKYIGLSRDEIADSLISVATRYAAIAGGITGFATSMNQAAILASAGMTLALFAGAIGAEMIYLARIQLRLILDLSVIYDLQLDPNDPEDILTIFGYALGITPQELVGKGLQIAASGVTKTMIKTYISKGTLQSIQRFASLLGFRILQRTLIQYSIPAVSIVIGSGFNYLSTLSLAKIAKTHLKNRGKVTEDLRQLVSRQKTYDIIFPVSVMYVAQVDGDLNEREREIYKAILSRMSFDEVEQETFNHLLKHEDKLLSEIAKLNETVLAETLLDLLILMAIYDGKLLDAERQFLTKAAETLNLPINLDEIEARAEEYKVDFSNKQWRKVTETMSESLNNAKDAGTKLIHASSDKAKTQLKKLFRKDDSNLATE